MTLVVDASGLGKNCTRDEDNDQADTFNVIQRRQDTGVHLKVDFSPFFCGFYLVFILALDLLRSRCFKEKKRSPLYREETAVASGAESAVRAQPMSALPGFILVSVLLQERALTV